MRNKGENPKSRSEETDEKLSKVNKIKARSEKRKLRKKKAKQKEQKNNKRPKKDSKKRNRFELRKQEKQEVRKQKQRSQKSKFKKRLTKVKHFFGLNEPPSNIRLKKMGYPKKRVLPVDAEGIQGDFNVYFNFRRYLGYQGITEENMKKYRLGWLYKLIPIDFIDRVVYDNDRLHDKAPQLYLQATDYNKGTMSEQYVADQDRRKKRWTFTGVVTVIVVGFVSFFIVPSYFDGRGQVALRNADYDTAYTMFSRSNEAGSDGYATYSRAFALISEEEFERGQELIQSIDDETRRNMGEMDLETSYQYAIGDYFMRQQRYAEAADVYRDIVYYEDARDKFNEAAYLAGDTLMENGRYREAVSNMEMIGDYKEATQKKANYVETIYIEAEKDFNDGNYEEASSKYAILTPYDYRNSSTMVLQAVYKEGIDAYEASDFDKAVSIFDSIYIFKDSLNYLKEIYYERGKAVQNENQFEAYQYFLNASGYKDTESILMQPNFVLFGEWEIVGSDGAAIDRIPIAFSRNYEFITNTEVVGLTTDTEYSFNQESERYEADGGDSYVEIDVNNQNEITIIAKNSDGEQSYNLRRTVETGRMFDENLRKMEEILNDYLANYEI